MATVQLKKTKIVELEPSYEKVIEWFFSYPQEETSLSDLCSQVRIAKTTARRVVDYLTKKEFLDTRPLGNIHRIRANTEHPYFTTKKIPSNLRHIYECGILDWIKEHIPHGKTIILFGSYRRGEDTQESDIDIAVEILEPEPLHITTLIIPEIGYRKDIDVNIHVFSRKKVDLNLFNSIANGITLSGFLEVKP